MKPSYLSIAILLVTVFLLSAPVLSAQAPVSQNQSTTPSASSVVTAEVPRLIEFSGTVVDARERPLAGPVGVTFALYAQQTGGAALWLETQNVKPDGNGNYTVLLGVNSANGVPAELFVSGEARWLGVQVEHGVEQPRVLLVSVPYALKAGDAETLGGLPPSAFARAGNSIVEPSNAVSSGALLSPVPAPATASFNASTDPNVTTLGGTVNFVPKFDTASDVRTSQIFDNGTDVGIGFPVTPTPLPVAKLDINGSANIRGILQLPATGTANSATKGFNSQPLDYLASVFNGTTALNQHFRWQAEPVNPGLSTASGKLNLLFASSTATPVETGLSINSKGQITFAAGQTFPTVTGNETVTGNVSANQLQSSVAAGTAPLVVKSTTQVANLNASFLGGLAASSYAQRAVSNTFLAPQSITVNKASTLIGDPGCTPGPNGEYSGLGFNGLDCSTYAIIGDGVDTFVNAPSGKLVLGVSNSQLVNITSSAVGIGTAAQPIALLTVDGSGNGNTIQGAQFAAGPLAAGVIGVGGVGISFPAPAGDGGHFTGGDSGGGGPGGFGVVATGGKNSDGTIQRAGEFNGDVEVTGCLSVSPGTPSHVQFGACLSDVRLKRNIESFPKVLDKVVLLQPVSYNWRTDEYPQFRFSSGKEIGLIAQEVEKVFPDMVSTDEAGYKRVNYGELPYLMLQAIREIKAESDNLKAENDDLRKRIQRLEAAAPQRP